MRTSYKVQGREGDKDWTKQTACPYSRLGGDLIEVTLTRMLAVLPHIIIRFAVMIGIRVMIVATLAGLAQIVLRVCNAISSAIRTMI